jgi:hypothetical protein
VVRKSQSIIGLYSGVEYESVSENQINAIAYYNENKNSQNDVIGVCEVLVETIKKPGILCSQQIRTLMRLGIIIYDGNPDKLDGATYNLSVDKEYCLAGVNIHKDVIITIPPFGYVIVCGKESVNIPHNICGSFDLKVRWFCRGLILSNGPQIFPGYQGRLMCLLFNTAGVDTEINTASDDQVFHFQAQGLNECTDRPYDGRYQRIQSVRDHIIPYAQYQPGQILFDTDGIRERIDSLPKTTDDLISAKEALQKEKGRRYSIILPIVAAFLAVVISLVIPLTGYYRITDYAERLAVLENIEKDRKGEETLNNYKDEIDSLKLQLQQLKDKLELKNKRDLKNKD